MHSSNDAIVRYSLLKTKCDYPAVQFRNDYFELVDNHYKDSVLIFTDGSKFVDRCGSAFVAYLAAGPHVVGKRLPNACGIFSAELYAVLLAVRYVKAAHLSNAVIFSDSVSVLQSLEKPNPDNRYLININRVLSSLDFQVTFEWVPGHCDIPGNEVADLAARDATQHLRAKRLPVIYSDLKHSIKSCLYNKWLVEWSRYNTRLNGIKPVILDWKSAYRDNRREEKVLSRLRTGCCRFLYQHHFDLVVPQEYCDFCRVPMTIKHLLINCINFSYPRRGITSYLRKNRLPLTEHVLLGDDFPHTILFKFLKDVDFFNKI